MSQFQGEYLCFANSWYENAHYHTNGITATFLIPEKQAVAETTTWSLNDLDSLYSNLTLKIEFYFPKVIHEFFATLSDIYLISLTYC